MKELKKIAVFSALIILISAVFGLSFSAFAAEEPNNRINLTVGENIVSNYYIDAAYYNAKGCDRVEYTFNGVSDSENYEEITESETLAGKETLVINANQAAAQIGEETVINIYKDGSVFETVKFSTKSYCDYIISLNQSDFENLNIQKGAALSRLCKAIITYGKAAQQAFNYAEKTASSAIIETDYAEELSLESASYSPEITKKAGDNVSFKSASFICSSKAKMRFYLDINNVDDSTVYPEPEITMPEGSSYEKGYVENGSKRMYFIQVNNIKPIDFDSKIVINYAGASLSMSVLDYAGAVINSASMSGTEKTLAKSLVVYNEKTEDYFAQKQTNIAVKLPNTADYLYRAGNANSIALSSLFKAQNSETDIESSEVSVSIKNKAGSASGTFTANSSDWEAATGVVELTAKQDGVEAAKLLLEVVSGTNVTGSNLSNVTSNNAVLLGNVNVPSTVTINNSKVLYGNGFTVTDTRSSTAKTSGYINMSGGGTIDNAVLIGQTYPSLVTDGINNEYYSPGVWITGNANIYNSYVSECKNAIEIKEGTVLIENTTVSGGAFSNINIQNANVTLRNCVTSTSTADGIKCLGIVVSNIGAKLKIEGSLVQHNWTRKADLPSSYQSMMSDVYNNSNYAYENGGSTYVNMGIMFISEGSSINTAAAQSILSDSTSNSYDFIEKTVLTTTATVYTANASMASETFDLPEYSPTVNGQHPLNPAATFDYTNKNYKAKTAGDNTYCYYDTATDKVLISFESGSSKVWDTSILTVNKNGNSISPSVSMSGINYTNKSITFTSEGDYDIVYTYTDPYNYNADGSSYNVIYTKTVHINVSVITPETVVYNAAFSYVGKWANNAKQVIGTDNKTYVMPDVSSTSSTIGSTTVAGKTVYYPIVSVPATGSNGNTAYSSGKGYYFAPAFNAINIVDFNQETGAEQYEYNASSTTWPHGKGYSAGPDSAVFGYASGAAYANQPYGRSMNAQYYKYGSNSSGLCYTSTDIEKDNTASNHLVQYHYVSNDGTTYYYYIRYDFGAMTYSSGGGCVAEGSLVTMADGSTKVIEDVQVGDMLLSWNHFTGGYEAQPCVYNMYHGTRDWTVTTLKLSDGTEVRSIYEHGFYDFDIKEYAYIRDTNVADYVGHTFAKEENGETVKVTLVDYEVTTENVGSYTLQTAYNVNFVVEGMLSHTAEDFCPGFFNYFEMGDDMIYDQEKMQDDIEKYGLFEAEDMADFLTPELFDIFNGKYYKVLIGKGICTMDDVRHMVELYL